jgi:ISXO2-like transposase domain/Transposase zinc-ribbon domain
MKLPQSELEAVRYFADEERCIKFVAEQRWPNGVICPTCGRADVSYLKTQRRWQCKSAHSKRQFSVKTGTIFEDSPLGLNKWLPAIWKIVNSKNGVSSYEMASALQITQKSAWFLNHRIREALKVGHFEKLSGTVEGDETYVGGRHHQGHKHGFDNKTAIVGLVEKKKGSGRARAYVTKTADATNAVGFMKANVKAGSTIHTDESRIYYNVKRDYKHEVVNHGQREYARGDVSTNSIEGVWNLFKRSYKGTYTHMAPKYLSRYVDEHIYRYNNRQLGASERFVGWFSTSGRRLAYSTLMANQPRI